MNRRLLPLIVLVVAAACDFKETRSGVITLTGASSIPLNGRNGAAQLVAGTAEITFKKGSRDGSARVIVRQNGRPDVDLEAAVPSDWTTGNFTLKGAEIGQPVDIASARSWAATGPESSYTDWEDRGFQRCRVDVYYTPCDESWTLNFSGASGPLGSFASRKGTRCNERRGMPYACHRDPSDRPDRFPHGGRHNIMMRANEIGAENIKFD